ncbi:MAG: hypothetical protein AB1540_12860, partial [Bdellovibrionota bacterium]
APQKPSGNPVELDRMAEQNWHVDLSEENREGAEMSGDEHSAGLEGGEREIEQQSHISTGLPGDRTLHEQKEGMAVDSHAREEENLTSSSEGGSLSIRKVV